MTAITVEVELARHDQRIGSLEKSDDVRRGDLARIEDKLDRILLAVLTMLGGGLLSFVLGVILKLSGHI